MPMYMDLLGVLHSTKTLPTTKRTCRVRLLSGNDIHCKLARQYNDRVIIDGNTPSVTYDLAVSDVSYVLYQTKTIYPTLPAGIPTPDRSNGSQWLIANLRAILEEVNTKSSAQYGGLLVIAVNYDQNVNGIRLTTSTLWDKLPPHIRCSFLQKLYEYVALMAKYYKVPEKLYRLFVVRSSDGNYIGSRTETRCYVKDGITICYKED